MFRLCRRLVPCVALLATGITDLPASAQWIASGRWGTQDCWGTQDSWRYVTPGTWMVLRGASPSAPVTISAEGNNHVGRIALWCDPETGTSALRFDTYFGDALRRPSAFDTQRAMETVTFLIDGQRFDRAFDSDSETRTWSARDVLDPAFLNAFSEGTRLELQNSSSQPRHRLFPEPQQRRTRSPARLLRILTQIRRKCRWRSVQQDLCARRGLCPPVGNQHGL